MKQNLVATIVASLGLMLSGHTLAAAIEAVYEIRYEDSSSAKAAIDELFKDEAIKGMKVTLYAHDFGVPGDANHTVVADYDDYASRDKLDMAMLSSHGWSKYELATHGSKSTAAELSIVVKDYGKARHDAGYLVAFIMQVRDPAAYVAAMDKMQDALGNPGVLRIVALRSGPAEVTHAVLVGGPDFAAVNEYLDKLYASEAFAEFSRAVSDKRTVLNIGMYRRVGHWGY